MDRTAIGRTILWVQGAFYLLTGLWPLVSLDTFLEVTGPKQDLWLVQTVGALVLVIGAALLAAAVTASIPLSVRVLGMGSAAAFVAVDVVFYLQGTIGAVYLLDAVAEAVLFCAWGLWWLTLEPRPAAPR